MKLNPEELPKFVTEPALLLCVQTSEKGTNVNVANAELKWSDEELVIFVINYFKLVNNLAFLV